MRVCGGDNLILARERSVGPEAERGEIDSKMGRRVCVCVNVLQILDIAIDLAKSLKETELTVAKPL